METAIVGLISAVAVKVLDIIYGVYRDKSGKSTKSDKAVKNLLYDRFFQCCRYHQGAEALTLAEKENLERLYQSYHDDYGGNGIGKQMYDELMKLPLK